MIGKWIVRLLKSGASTILIILLFLKLDWKQIAHLRPSWAMLSIFLFFLNITISALRWKIILQALKVEAPYTFLWRVYISSVFWNSFLPTTIGGDGHRFFAVSSKFPYIPKKTIISSLLIDRATGLIALGLVHFVCFAHHSRLLFSYNSLIFWAELMIGVVWSAGIGLLLILWKILSFQTIKISRWEKKMRMLIEGMRQINSTTFIQSVALSVLFVFVSSTGIWIYYNMAGKAINWEYSVYLSTLASFIGMIPVSINGIGSTEWAIILAAQSFHIAKKHSVAAMVLFRLFATFHAILGGIIYFYFGRKHWILLEEQK